jgi:hypothetical protein
VNEEDLAHWRAVAPKAKQKEDIRDVLGGGQR